MVIETILWIPAIFGLIGAFGLIRMKNVYTRIFASTMCAVGCTCSVMLLLAIQSFYSLLSMKYLLLFFLIVLTFPTASHAIANAAYHNRVDLKRKGVRKK